MKKLDVALKYFSNVSSYLSTRYDKYTPIIRQYGVVIRHIDL